MYVMFENLLVLTASSLYAIHLRRIMMVVVFIILDWMRNCFDEDKNRYSLLARLVDEVDNLLRS